MFFPRGALAWLLLAMAALFSISTAYAETYVEVRDGHLGRDGQRIRLWGTNLNPGHLFNHEHPVFYCEIVKGGN